MRHSTIPQDFFTNNRAKLIKQLDPVSFVIINSNDEMPRNGDVFFPFRQNSDLFYLSGIIQEKSILVLFPKHPDPELRELLFIKETNEDIKIWEGEKLSKKEASEISGVKHVEWLDKFQEYLSLLMSDAQSVYLNSNENPRFESSVVTSNIKAIENIKKEYPLHNYKRIAPILSNLRLIKEPEEIDLIQYACDITEKAFFRVLKFVKPGVMEYEVEAEMTHEFTINRANGHAYLPIVASGANSCILHYIQNNKACENGDLLLMDFGAEYANYAADCSRTIPVNGRFTTRQRECYLATLRVFRETVQLLVPGTTLAKVQTKVLKFWEKEHINLGLYSKEDVKNQDSDKPIVKKYFMHGVSHFLGLDVHDVGSKSTVLKAGMVVTCEPGIYIPEENIGIRLENNILISDEEPVDLTENIPIEPYDIEKLMA